MSDKRRSIATRVSRFGLRVMCAACCSVDRHFPGNGRLRDATCKVCGRKFTLKTLHWIDGHEGRWSELVKRWGGRLAPFTHPR